MLKGVNLEINAGQRVAIMGASGSGKKHVDAFAGRAGKAQFRPGDAGWVDLNKVSGAKLGALRNSSLGFIYQFHHLLGEFTILENVAMPLLIGKQAD